MKIEHKIDDFLYTIFPDVDRQDTNALAHQLQDFYAYGPYKPKVTIMNDWVTIEIDFPSISSEAPIFKRVIDLSEKRKFNEASSLLSPLIQKNPTNSEYHRVMGQILSEKGNQDEAINYLIDALRWDSKNSWALIMMGNIYAKYKNDIATAMKYYDQAIVANPKDNIAVNNIGANLIHQGKMEKAKKYFWKALEINSEYPNTHFALGMIAEMENDFDSAFFSTCKAIRLSKTKDILYHNSVQHAIEIALKLTSGSSGMQIVNAFLKRLEKAGGKKIVSKEDSGIPTAAKFEFAENYDRDYHSILYKPGYPSIEHLITHELVHLHFVIEARAKEVNQLFISNKSHRFSFIKNIEIKFK